MNAMNSTMRLALLLGLVVGYVNAACPSNFVASTTIPGKCYHITTDYYDFFSAIGYCRNNLTHGADILSIANGFENSEVASLLQSRGIGNAWIGNAFYDNESHWITTAAGSSNYSNWGSDTFNGNAASITPSGSWDYMDSDIGYSICQFYPDDPTTFPPQITCLAGWTPSISVRGKCYKNIGEDDFFSATRECLTTRIGDSHTELVTITSQLEMMELYVMQSDGAWASLASWEADGYWHWVETLHPTDYFGPYGPPSNYHGGTCAYLDSYNLYGISCWFSGGPGAICQYFPYEPPGPLPPGLFCPQNGIASLTKPGTCYYVLSQNQTFQNARSACQALNTGLTHNDLFVPRTLGEYEEFEGIVSNRFPYPRSPPVWLGLTISNDNWDWISGRSSNITNIWCPGQPDTSQNPNDQCAFVIYPNFSGNQICWMAGNCTYLLPAICQSTSTF